jgi:hypothetical protein
VRRLIAAAAVAALAGFGPTGTAQADICAGSVLCALNGCTGTVNVCPSADSCSGFVSVCPFTHPRDCHSSIDVCLGPFTIVDCGPQLQSVCDLIPTAT